jgi:hypothetical protein
MWHPVSAVLSKMKDMWVESGLQLYPCWTRTWQDPEPAAEECGFFWEILATGPIQHVLSTPEHTMHKESTVLTLKELTCLPSAAPRNGAAWRTVNKPVQKGRKGIQRERGEWGSAHLRFCRVGSGQTQRRATSFLCPREVVEPCHHSCSCPAREGCSEVSLAPQTLLMWQGWTSAQILGIKGAAFFIKYCDGNLALSFRFSLPSWTDL